MPVNNLLKVATCRSRNRHAYCSVTAPNEQLTTGSCRWETLHIRTMSRITRLFSECKQSPANNSRASFIIGWKCIRRPRVKFYFLLFSSLRFSLSIETECLRPHDGMAFHESSASHWNCAIVAPFGRRCPGMHLTTRRRLFSWRVTVTLATSGGAWHRLPVDIHTSVC